MLYNNEELLFEAALARLYHELPDLGEFVSDSEMAYDLIRFIVDLVDEGYRSGMEDGLSKGLSDGRSEGYELGQEEGRKEGYRDGWDDGYCGGYDHGYSKAELHWRVTDVDSLPTKAGGDS